MMQVNVASQAAPGRTNEDVAVVGDEFVVVLDGATAVPGLATGCRHDVVWFTRHLGAALAGRLIAGGAALATVLYEAIDEVVGQHSGSCDLSNPDSPSATVSILRRRAEWLDYLVLADSPVLLDLEGEGVRPILDDRLDHLADYSVAAVGRSRNRDFWVASTVPAAAQQAVTGSVPVSSVRRAAVLSDGAARLVERFGQLSWGQLLDLLESAGPAEVIARTRSAEEAAEAVRGKRYDDATAVFIGGW
jgi:hypothetical protein